MTRRTRAAVVTLLLVLVSACAPQTPEEDSWREDALLTVTDVRSSVQTARIALQQSADDRVFDSYLQTVVLDAEDTAGSSSQKFGGLQPPRQERERYDAVTGLLDAAVGLLSDVRIAVVARNEGHYDDLAALLQDTVTSLDRLDHDLRQPPTDPAGPSS